MLLFLVCYELHKISKQEKETRPEKRKEKW